MPLGNRIIPSGQNRVMPAVMLPPEAGGDMTALRASEERLRLAIDATGLGIWDVDARTGRRTWSDEMRAILGIGANTPADPALFAGLIHPDDQAWVNEAYARAYDPSGGGQYRAEFRINRADDGAERWVLTTGRITFDPATREPVRAIGTLLDITDRKAAEAALRESGERLSLALQAGGLGSWELDLRTSRRTFSARSAAIFGIDPADIAERSAWRRIVHPDDMERVGAALKDAIEHGRDYRVEFRVRLPSGGDRWVASQALVRRDRHGQPTSIIGIHADITEQKRNEEAMRASEGRFRGIFNSHIAGLTLFDTRTGETLIVNDRFLEIVGRSRESWERGEWDWRMVTPERHLHLDERAVAQARERGWWDAFEKEYLRPDGTLVPVRVSSAPLPGEPGRVVVAVDDITEDRRTQAALRESEARFRATQEHADVGIAEVDAQSRYMRVNEAFCTTTGYSREELQHLTLWDITHPDHIAEDRANLERQISTKAAPAYAVEKRFIRKDRSVGWALISASAVHDEKGEFLYGVRVVQDISERKRAEEHQRLLINELNHRVKNTLATVQSITSQTLRSARSPEEAQAAVEARLLALSRAHDVLSRENWEGAGLREIVDEATAPFRRPESERIVAAGPDVRLSTRVALALAMALHELATNAVKYGALSNATGTVGLRWTVDARGHLTMTWREAGGPPVVAPTRRGFGTRLIERSLAQDLQGRAEVAFEPGGVVCRFSTVLSDGPA